MNWAIRLIAILALLSVTTAAQAAADRVALVLGLGAYQTIEPLDNTRNDASAMADTLSGIGFDVTLALDATSAQLHQLLDDFAFRSETADLALIYFAGHGVEVQGENFLIPVDANLTSNRDVQRQSVSLSQLLSAVERARTMRIVILDSCRDNPLGDLIELQTASTGSRTEAGRGRKRYLQGRRRRCLGRDPPRPGGTAAGAGRSGRHPVDAGPGLYAAEPE